MDINNLKMGDMFFLKDEEALVIVVEGNTGPIKTILIIDDELAFYLDPEKDKTALAALLSKIEGAEKASMDSVCRSLREKL